MEILFKAVCTKNTIFIKNIIDTISQVLTSEILEGGETNFLKQMMMRIDENGVEFYSDYKRRVSTVIKVNKDFFSEFIFNDVGALSIGISLDILKSCFKYINRNDEVKISIKKEELALFPNTIDFTINNNKGFNIKINIIQNMMDDENEKFIAMVDLASNRTSNIYKELGGSKKPVKLILSKESLKLSTNMIDIAESWLSIPLSNPSEEEIERVTRIENFKITSKLSVFNDKCKLLIDPETLNLKFKSDIINIKTSKNKSLGEVTISIVIS